MRRSASKRHPALRTARWVLAFAAIAAGVVMLVVPGPGLLAIVIGLALLAPELPFVRRWSVKLARRFAPRKAPVVERTMREVEHDEEARER